MYTFIKPDIVSNPENYQHMQPDMHRSVLFRYRYFKHWMSVGSCIIYIPYIKAVRF